jgi:hypothetical protein
MRLLFFLFPLSWTWGLCGQPVSKIAFSESQSSVRAFSPAGQTTLPAVRLQLDARRPDGRTERSNLIVVYDPETGHYFWRNIVLNHPGETISFYEELDAGWAALYSTPSALLFFGMTQSLYIEQHSERSGSLDSAESAVITEIGRRLLAGSGYDIPANDIPVYKEIGRAFACDPLDDRPDCWFTAKSIVCIDRDGDNWRLVVKNRWDQEIILNSKFELVSTRRLPPGN